MDHLLLYLLLGFAGLALATLDRRGVIDLPDPSALADQHPWALPGLLAAAAATATAVAAAPRARIR